MNVLLHWKASQRTNKPYNGSLLVRRSYTAGIQVVMGMVKERGHGYKKACRKVVVGGNKKKRL